MSNNSPIQVVAGKIVGNLAAKKMLRKTAVYDDVQREVTAVLKVWLPPELLKFPLRKEAP